MSFLSKLKPRFWDHQDVAAGPYRHLFNFRRIWKLAVFLTASVAIIPLVTMAVIDYNVTQQAVESEILMRTSRLVSNIRRTVSFFLVERKAALDFIDQDNTYEQLNDHQRLAEILANLKKGFGAFADLGVIDHRGRQRAYVGPYDLAGKDYSGQEWFQEVRERGVYISDVFLGYRNTPHLVIAIKHDLAGGFFYVIRASLDTARFNALLTELEVSGQGDAFIINRQGVLQTPSRYQGRVLEKISLPVPEFSVSTRVYQTVRPENGPLVVGYAYIEETPFVLMIVKHRQELMRPWYSTRLELIGFLAASLTVILMVVLFVATYLVNHIHMADQKRVMTLHQVEYSNKLASIGRLAAGVAHEINNPLAIINEKAGLIKDMLIFRKGFVVDEKMIETVDGCLKSVDRCAAITKRLLNFARHVDVSIGPVNLKEAVCDVLGFLNKEAEYRSIKVNIDVPDSIPDFETDRGKLQQILLNLINNAFAAISDGGCLDIRVRPQAPDSVLLVVGDNGCGIPEGDIKRIFEPFFSTKAGSGGTGLGLSITYSLVRELGGQIEVKSEAGKGTSFYITLPLKWTRKERQNVCEYY